ncbi:helix-turn-helix domain-containing protein [Microbacterium sp. p3-SID336]|uniref:helix-turn-helix domain-containing protein n=1 Tax=Microbacterium sp. p3-SID336 TaxID=2916212 RepID=UPI0021A862D2|nr:helix-turn-helix domain-containing protein [Microbacterium sp. p3-SID336]MCT1477667.1 helix-turn-helix domain-containing protein [Microbacterium sp. p3-SID336]
MNRSAPMADVVLHPVRLRIILQFGGRELTTAELRRALPDVTQATLYRHVSALVDAGILVVVQERKVRGAIERTLALGDRMAHVDEHAMGAMEDARLRTAFLTFLGELGAGFDRFLSDPDTSSRGFAGFGQTPLHVTEADLGVIQHGLTELLAPYRDPDREGVRRVDLATVVIPHTPAGDGASDESDAATPTGG